MGVPAPLQPLRHWIISLRAGAWADILAGRALSGGERTDDVLRDWVECGRPLIARRRTASDRADQIAAAVTFPPSFLVRRLALAVPVKAVARTEPPPTLAVARAAAPRSWHETFDALAALGQAVAGEPRVFGSFAWQALTGLPYVTARSDLDLLWPLTPSLDVPALLAGLVRLGLQAPGRLDGELVHGATGAGVQWQEWAGDADEVLVKGEETAVLQKRAAFLAGGSGVDVSAGPGRRAGD